MMTKKRKTARDWHAVDAHFRNSAGAMKDRRVKYHERLLEKEIEEELLTYLSGCSQEEWEEYYGKKES